MTPIDAAHAAMEADPDADAPRLAFYQRLAETELFLILDREAAGEVAEPRVLQLSTGPVVTAFDTEERLADFAGAEAAYIALPGRQLVRMLAGQRASLGLNLGVAPSAFLMPPEAVDWLAALLSEAPREVGGRVREVTPPHALPEALLTALDRKLARAGGLAACAYLSGVVHDDGRRGHLLALIDTDEGARAGPGSRDRRGAGVLGSRGGGTRCRVLRRVGRGVGATGEGRAAVRSARTARRAGPAPSAPGMDPDRPPKLRQ